MICNIKLPVAEDKSFSYQRGKDSTKDFSSPLAGQAVPRLKSRSFEMTIPLYPDLFRHFLYSYYFFLFVLQISFKLKGGMFNSKFAH